MPKRKITHVKGHIRHINNKKVWVKPHNRIIEARLKYRSKNFQQKVEKYEKEEEIERDFMIEVGKLTQCNFYSYFLDSVDLCSVLRKYNLTEDDFETIMDKLYKKGYLTKSSFGSGYAVTKLGNTKIVEYNNIKLNRFTKKELEALIWQYTDELRYYDFNKKDPKYKIVEKLKEKGIKQEYITDFLNLKHKIEKLSNNEKRALYYLSSSNIDTEQISKLFDKSVLQKLKNKNLIATDLFGYKIINCNEFSIGLLLNDLVKKLPPYAPGTMRKEIPQEFIDTCRSLAKTNREYAIGIDFERELKNPQQLIAAQGAESFTYKIDDFEVFGHTHPNRHYARPSFNDVKLMVYGKPEFIVSGYGDILVLNIENYAKFHDFRKTEKEDKYYKFLSSLSLSFSKEDRKYFYEQTGVAMYSYKKGMKLKMIDDLELEKQFPIFRGQQLQKIKESLSKK